MSSSPSGSNQSLHATAQTMVAAERTTREAADTTLQDNIDNEAATARAAESANADAITAEEAAREAADTTLQSNINAADAAAVHLTGDETVAGAKTFSDLLSASGGLNIVGSENNNILIVENENGTLNDGTLHAMRAALRFNWYDTHWQIGNIRGGGSDSYGFGIALSGTDLKLLVSNYQTIFYEDLTLTGDLHSVTANTGLIGTANLPFAGGYVQTALSVTSAKEAKTDITGFTEAEIAVAEAVVKACPQLYKLKTSVAEKGEDSARRHSGSIYETVYQCFEDGGLDPEKYSVFTAAKRQKTETKTRTRTVITVTGGKAVQTTETESCEEPVCETLDVVDADGSAVLSADGKTQLTYENPVYATGDDGNVLYDKSLRYEELMIWYARGLLALNEELTARVAALETTAS